MRLQGRVGNAAVARLLAPGARARRPSPGPPTPAKSPAGGGQDGGLQRLATGGAACPAPPVAPVPADPKADPKFAAVESQIAGAASTAKKHPSGAAEADQARKAAEPPADDKASQAKAAQADQMAAAKPKGFDKAAFMAAVKAAIAKAAPQNLDEADKFATSGKAEAVKGEVMGKVTAGKQSSAGDIAAKTAQPPDPSAAKEKPVTPLPPQPPAKLPAVDGAKAMPGKAPAEQTDLRAGPCGVSSSMAEADVSDKDLAASNEPQMQGALAAKQEAQAHAAQAPAQIRQKEGEALQQAQTGASADAKTAVTAMAAAKGKAGAQVGAQKNTAKAREETERKRISGDINKIYDKAKGEVETILKGLDTLVTDEFTKGEAEARSAFTAKHKADMEKYKDERYSGVTGWARWTGDLFAGVPKEANDIFARARALYEEKMSAVISRVADIIGRELDAAKAKIAAARKEIQAYVAAQPKDLQKIAQAAATDVSGKFDQLESDVDEKQNSLVDDLAEKYVEARNAVDEEIKAEQAKNEGLVDKAKNAIGESIGAILKLKDLFMGLLSKAASAFKAIVAAPVTFISNFMSAVKQGFMNFASNILEHLKKGLQGWLFGQLASAGIQLPEKFDLMGIVKMLAQLLGLTWSNIKSRILAKMPLLAKVIDVVESKVEIFVVLATKGIAGIWDWIKEKVGDVKEMIFGQIKSFVIEKVVKAGITWVLGMLNPAGALIKIVQALISVVQWIMERGQEMGEFIGTIIDAVMDVARGGLGGVPAKIEASLSKAVPLVISFLAGLLGLGGISEKVKAIFEKAQGYLGKAIDWVVDKGLKLARPIIKLAMKGLGYVKKKYEGAKAYVKGKYEAGKAYVKKKYEAAKGYVKKKYEAAKGRVKGALGIGEDKPTKSKKPGASDQKSIDAALTDATGMLDAGTSAKAVRGGLGALRRKHALSAATLVPGSGSGAFHIHVQRVGGDTKDKVLTPLEALTISHDACKSDFEALKKLKKTNRVKQALAANPDREKIEAKFAECAAKFARGKSPEKDYRLLKAGKSAVTPEDLVKQYDQIKSDMADIAASLTKAMQQNVKPDDLIEVARGKGTYLCIVVSVTDTNLTFTGHDTAGTMSGTLALSGMDKVWWKSVAETKFKVGPAFEAIRHLDDWGTNFADARQVLSYRAHGKFTVPPGMNWHHIHEQTNIGPNTVKNLALASKTQNAAFNDWFAKAHGSADGCPWTEDKPLREFLRGKDATTHEEWGLLCIRKLGYRVERKDQGRGPFQVLV